MVLQERHHQGTALGGAHGLHGEHPALRVGVVVQDRRQRLPSRRQRDDVVLRHGQRGLVNLDGIDPDHALRGGGPVTDGVGQVEGARLGRVERDDPGVDVGGGAQPLGRFPHGGQAQGVAVGIDVIGQRRDLAGLAHRDDDVVRVGHRGQVLVAVHLDRQAALGVLGAVGVGDGQVRVARRLPHVLDRDGAVGPVRDVESRGE